MGAGEGNVDELVDGVAKVGREAWELMTREDDTFCASNLFVYFWKFCMFRHCSCARTRGRQKVGLLGIQTRGECESGKDKGDGRREDI